MTRKKKKKKAPPPPTPFLSEEFRRELKGFGILAGSLLSLFCLIFYSKGLEAPSIFGPIGQLLGWSFYAFFGIPVFFLFIFSTWIGWRLLFGKPMNHLRYKIYLVGALLFSSSMLLHVIEETSPVVAQQIGELFFSTLWQKKIRFHLGGAPLHYLYRDAPFLALKPLLNQLGVLFLSGTLFLLSFLVLFKIRITNILSFFYRSLKQEKKDETQQEEESFLRYVRLHLPRIGGKERDPKNPDVMEITPEKELSQRPSLSRKGREELSQLEFKPKRLTRKDLESSGPFGTPQTQEEIEIITSLPPKPKVERAQPLPKRKKSVEGDFSNYHLPPKSLLTNAKWMDQSILKKDLKKQAEVLEETLTSFSIEAKVGQINCGPTITSFEVHPAIGVKVQRIKTLESDIALNMEAKSIRIIAPIPGKAAVGIEVPNAKPQEVGFKEMLAAYQESKSDFHIPILLGKAVNGDYVMSDLAKMPHCIIAGATGSGKSVCINTIVMSIVMNARPDEIKMVMVDPKKVELTPYSSLPHMLAPVITEPMGACAALKWLVREMEVRYEILKLVGLRNIDAFNKREKDEEKEASIDREIPDKMYYIVLIVDELADLMMVASQDIETPIARLAQMARAVGIHVILATQRPSREVITGLIKANFPTRIAFKVASRVNSQIILDETGAETLLGNGDLLFLPPGASHVTRAQGAYIRDKDLNSIIKYICEQAPHSYVIESFEETLPFNTGGFGGKEDEPEDELYPQAYDVITSTGNASTTFLQRKLKIGYARAASLIDALEKQGIVGPPEGSRPRKILVLRNAEEEEGEV